MKQEFKDYINKLDFQSNNAKRLEIFAKVYTDWLKKNTLNIENTAYKDIMDFIGYLQKQGKTVHYINRTLQAVSHYYRFLELPDIAMDVRVRGTTKTTPEHIYTADELDQIYESFENLTKWGHYRYSNKIILGLIIYQALDMLDIYRLETSHLKIKEAKLYVPKGKQKLARAIDLEAKQVLPLYEYIYQHRPGLIQKHNTTSEKLFAPQADKYDNLHHQMKTLAKTVKKQVNEKLGLTVLKLMHLRQSRITIWSSQHGIRKTQYLAGFRRVLSAERYQQANLEDLKEQINQHHPLGNEASAK